MVNEPHIFISATPKAGHEREVSRLFQKLVDFCDETKAGVILTGFHRLPKSRDIVLTINFHTQEQEDDFLKLDAYRQFRIDLVEHCEVSEAMYG